MPTYLWALLASALPAFVAGYSLGAARHVSSRTGAPSAVGVASNAFRTLRTRGGQMQTAVSVKDAGLCKKLEVPSELLDSVDIFIFDCDGVIWKGDSLIDGVPAVLEMLRKAGKKIFFVTNNSTKSRKGYKGKFTSLGLEVEPEEIFSSSFAAAAYLEQTKFKETGKKVYIVGEVGIQEELDLIGVPHIGGPEDGDKKIELKSGFALPHDEDVGAVIVGFDRNINYYKIQYAQLCINENPGCQFIVTNLDAVTHLTDAQEWAGNGAMAGAIKGCTGQEPVLVGKPSALMIDYIVEKYGCAREKICMVGDRLDTDILFGQNNGLQSCLTLSGVTTETKLLSEENKIKPDFYVGSIAEFM
jgi:4-nitrophenyl phosphatase/phosphoglycolate phosphatase